jgi:mannose-6-phosphate isomerase-like protein (cupin superfamily)
MVERAGRAWRECVAVTAAVWWVAGLIGCADAGRHDPFGRLSPSRIAQYVKDHPCPDDQPYVMAELQRDRRGSLHLLQVRRQMPMRFHYDHTVVLRGHSGRGYVQRGGVWLPMMAGAAHVIPQRTPYMVMNSERQPLVCVAYFSPPLDEGDVHEIEVSRTMEQDGQRREPSQQ